MSLPTLDLIREHISDLWPLLQDPPVTEVMVNPDLKVFVERAGRIESVEVSRLTAKGLRSAITIIAHRVKNVTFQELTTAPYRASVDFDQVTLAQGRQERKRETVVAQLTFTVLNSVPNAFVPVNPLGIQVTHLRVDQAF